MTENNEVMATKQLAEFLKVSPNLIRAEAKKGNLPCSKIGNEIRFNKADVLEKIFGRK